MLDIFSFNLFSNSSSRVIFFHVCRCKIFHMVNTESLYLSDNFEAVVFFKKSLIILIISVLVVLFLFFELSFASLRRFINSFGMLYNSENRNLVISNVLL